MFNDRGSNKNNYSASLSEAQRKRFDKERLYETTIFLRYANIIGLLPIIILGIYDWFIIDTQSIVNRVTILKAFTTIILISFTVYYYIKDIKKVSGFTHNLNLFAFLLFLLSETIIISSEPQQIFHILTGLVALNLSIYLVFNLKWVATIAFSLATLLVFNINFFNLKEVSSINIGYIDANLWFILATTASVIIKQHTKSVKLNTFLVKEHLKEANLTKYKLFGVVSHDLKNIISSLTGLTSFLKTSKHTVDKEMMDKMLDAIHDSSTDALSIFEELMVWIKSQMNAIAPTLKELDINNFLETLSKQMTPLANNKNISIEVNNSTLNSIKSDANILALVLRNIISNAVKFSNEGTTIEVNSFRKTNNFYIEVKDYGIGIPESKIANLESGGNISSTHGTKGERGTGLGINLSKTLLSQINGNIEITSEEGKGTSVLVHLKEIEDRVA